MEQNKKFEHVDIMRRFIDDVIRTKEDEVKENLIEFYEKNKNSSVFVYDNVSLDTKSSYIRKLIESLSLCIHSDLKWSEETKFLALQALRILCREPDGCDDIYTESGITTLMEYAGLKSNSVKGKEDENGVVIIEDYSDVIIEAMKCLSNSLLQHRQSQEYFDNSNGIRALLQNLSKVKEKSLQAQFLILRLIFLSTIYQENLNSYINEYDTINTMVELFQPILDNISESSKNYSTTILPGQITYSIVLSELLKVLFNFMVNEKKAESSVSINTSNITVDDEIAQKYKIFIPLLVKYFNLSEMPNPPLSPPYTHAIHALMNFPVKNFEDLYFPNDDYSIVYSLKEILETTILKSNISHSMENDDNDAVLISGVPVDSILPPLIILLTNIAAANEKAKSILKESILPSDFDRSKPLNVGEDIRASLIRLMTNTLLGNSRETISTLLYTLCNCDANLFVNQIGYGNAIGYLVNHQLMGELNLNEENPKTESDKPINPITGQYEDTKKEDPFKNMTEEEKEREAEKLFVLFDRLNKTGIIKVVPKHPGEDSNSVVDDLD